MIYYLALMLSCHGETSETDDIAFVLIYLNSREIFCSNIA